MNQENPTFHAPQPERSLEERVMSQEKPRVSTAALREYFVLQYIKPIITNPMVLRAFEDVDRGDFIHPYTFQEVFPYDDSIIQLEEQESSLSQPTLLAKMIELLQLTGKEKVLDMGTGSGCAAAILSRCSAEVHTIEYNEHLASNATRRLDELGFAAVHVHTGDGAKGVPESAPYDAILVTAGTREIPQALFDQLKDEGIIVAPTVIGEDAETSHIVSGIKRGNELHLSVFYEVGFYPLVSDEHGGWSSQSATKQRLYDVIFDDKEPKNFPKVQLATELTEEKKKAAGLEALSMFGMNLKDFTNCLSANGMLEKGRGLICQPEHLYRLVRGIKNHHPRFILLEILKGN